MSQITKQITWNRDDHTDLLVAEEWDGAEWVEAGAEVIPAVEDEAPYVAAEDTLLARLGWDRQSVELISNL